MSFDSIKQLTTGTSNIKIKDKTIKIKLLSVSQREQYDNLANEGFGTIQANFGGNAQQKANMNIVKVNQAQKRAEHYLIKMSFPEDNVEEKDIDELYDIYPELVSQLKQANGIIDTDNEEAVRALTNDTENAIKKQ